MAKAKHSWECQATVDGLCAATGWSRFYAIGYLVTWSKSTAAARITEGDYDTIRKSLPWQTTDEPVMSRTSVLGALVRMGIVHQDGGRFIIGSAPKKKRAQSQLAIDDEEPCPGHWEAYARPYEARHGYPPLEEPHAFTEMKKIHRSVKCQFMNGFLRFYVAHPGFRYTNAMHPLWMARQDVGKLHTEFKRQRVESAGKVRSDAMRDETRAQQERILRGEI